MSAGGRPRRETLPVCALCGEPIGAYEPMMVLFEDGRWERSSISRLHAGRTPSLLLHERCAGEGERTPPG